MAISLRLDSKTERAIKQFADAEGKTRSDLIRGLIVDFVNKNSGKKSPWELGKHLFGKDGSGLGNLSIDRKKILKEKLHAKKSGH